MKRMLVNAIRNEELRIALVDNDKLFDLDIEKVGFAQKKANIYKGRITSIEPSLEAAFVDFGSTRHGFLPLKEIDPAYFTKQPEDPNERPNIQEVLQEGKQVIVQVEKDERGNKGAALTTFLTIAGAYLVLMPNNPRAGGISRRIEGEEREELKEILSKLPIPENMGVIVRTAGVNKTHEELAWDLDMLLKQWEAIKQAAEQKEPPFLIQQESDIVMRAVRDYLRHDIEEIVVDNQEVYNKVEQYISQVRPDFKEHLRFYQNPIPVFNYYQIEHQIETAFQREVELNSGGAIVIDQTEALVTIDINSAKATKGGDIEETALNTNLEAADEIARQLRLRDIGGLVVVDFIDMSDYNNQRRVEARLRDALRIERARTQIGRISKFGLLEMSRQRLGTTLGEASQVVCPRCNGRGTMRSVEATCTSLLRMIEEHGMKPNTVQVQIQVPVEIGTYLLNEKRKGISEIQQRQNVQVVVLPNPHYQQPHYKIDRIQQSEKQAYSQRKAASYNLIETPDVEPIEPSESKQKANPEKPILQPALNQQRQGGQPKKQSQSLIKRLWESMFGSGTVDKNRTKAGTPGNRPPQRKGQQRSQGQRQKNARGQQSRSKQQQKGGQRQTKGQQNKSASTNKSRSGSSNRGRPANQSQQKGQQQKSRQSRPQSSKNTGSGSGSGRQQNRRQSSKGPGGNKSSNTQGKKDNS